LLAACAVLPSVYIKKLYSYTPLFGSNSKGSKTHPSFEEISIRFGRGESYLGGFD